MRYDKELYSIYKGQIVTDVVRSTRLRWVGHVGMNDNEPPKNYNYSSSPGGQRRRGHPKLRWIGGVEKDVRRLGCRNCKTGLRMVDGEKS